MLIQKNLNKTLLPNSNNNKKSGIASKVSIFLISTAFVISTSQTVNAEANQCNLTVENNSSGQIAAWDFNAGDLPSEATGMVIWQGDHGGVKSIPNTSLQGIEFTFKATDIDKDSSNEWRYTMTSPMPRTWEYLKVYQPTNFYHRSALRIESPIAIDSTQWKVGDRITNLHGVEAVIAKIDGYYIYVTDYEEMFNKNWGAGQQVLNISNNASFISEGYRYLVDNNKFSTQWHGKYSNAGMTMETESQTPERGYKLGVSYCRPTVNSSESHRGRGTERNQINNGEKAECFNPDDNGTVVEFVVERIRSTSLTSNDGSYRIWKKTASTNWQLIFENTNLTVYQPDNYFTDGYVFGWSNSGFAEDTTFYLTGWELWSVKPDFIN